MRRDYYLFRTGSGNRYCFNAATGGLLLCHPLLYHMITLHRQGQSVSAWLAALTAPPRVESAQWRRAEVEEQWRKFASLDGAGFFAERDEDPVSTARLTPGDVRHALLRADTLCFELTEACNLRCAYCCYGEHFAASTRRSARHLDLDTAVRALDHMYALWGDRLPPRVTIGFYGGEPLLRFAVVRAIVEHARRLDRERTRLTFTMTTNGTLLDRHADYLAENDFELLISLDGDRTADSYRVFSDGRESHDRVLHNAKSLQRSHPSYFDRRVQFSAVFTDRGDVERIHDFFATQFGKAPILGDVNPFGVARDGREAVRALSGNTAASLQRSPRRAEIEKAMFPRLPPAAYVMRFLLRHSPTQFPTYADVLDEHAADRRLPTGTCIPFTRKLFVTVEGEILPCERVGRSIVLGRVGVDGLEIDCAAIARAYNHQYDRLTELCAACHRRRDCPQCVLQLELERPDASCPAFASEQAFTEYLAHVFGYLEENPWVVSRVMESELV